VRMHLWFLDWTHWKNSSSEIDFNDPVPKLLALVG
jgi:hypothetical protein